MAIENLVVRLYHRRTFIEQFTARLDPKDVDGLIAAGRQAVKRNGWSEAFFPEFSIDVEEEGRWGKQTIGL